MPAPETPLTLDDLKRHAVEYMVDMAMDRDAAGAVHPESKDRAHLLAATLSDPESAQHLLDDLNAALSHPAAG